MRFRYSRWDGTQRVDLDADDALAAMADDLLLDGDVSRAVRRLFQQGLPRPGESRATGARDLVRRLRRERQARLDRYDLGGSLDDIRRKLDQVVSTERAGIDRWLAATREDVERGRGTPATQRAFEEVAAARRASLDRLPVDPAGRLRNLLSYDFVDPEARRLFQELLTSLRQSMLKPHLSGMQQALDGMTPGDLARLREMVQDLNRLLAEKAVGPEPDFDAFRNRWGQHFPGVESLDQLLDELSRQAARLGSLLASLSPGERRQLEDMTRSLLLRDERLEAALAQLAMHLADLAPSAEGLRQYEFAGQEPVTLEQAMQILEELHGIDRLEEQLGQVTEPRDLDGIDPAELERLLGPEAARDLAELRELTRKLEEAGYVERRGDRLELTARAIRKIGDKALHDVFAHLRRDRIGGHAAELRGAGGERVDESRPYEFGDPFWLDLRETLMSAVIRDGAGTPVRLQSEDFAVFRTELRTQAATVVMLDLSRSMINNGYFLPAKKVAMALAALIRGQFPRDALHVVGFSLYAHEIGVDRVPHLSWRDCEVGTNMHAGFLRARQLLGRRAGANRQIILITDGEPTAHLEGGVAEFSYPPTSRTVRETLQEVQRCTRDGITINTFMLERSPALATFVEEMARINRGRAFFATPARLGEYVLVDYVRTRRRRVS
jgi:uncharacterized protein with von Willebrand factor type A (vWA) domain